MRDVRHLIIERLCGGLINVESLISVEGTVLNTVSFFCI